MRDIPPSLSDRLNVALFAALLVIGGVAFLVWPRQSVSLAEKRRLAAPPPVTLAAVLAGKTGAAADDYYSDHFEFRDRFLALAERIKAGRGFAGGDYQVLDTTDRARPATAAAAPHTGASPTPDAAAAEADDGDYDNIKSVVVYHGRAVQISMGSRSSAARYAAMVNAYHAALPAAHVYSMAIPVGSDWYLPHAISKGEAKEQRNIADVAAALAPGVVPVDAYGALAKHTGEYIYYRTDHHWTGLGAYWAYRAFADAAHLAPVLPRQLTHKAIPGFLGSLYYYTRSDALKDAVDTVDYWTIPQPTSLVIYRARGTGHTVSHLYAEHAKGVNAYGVFMGGDWPIAKIVSPQGGPRKILVIKDSYGDAFAPYLAANYGEVWVVDYRYFWGNLAALVREHGIDDVLFAHNTYVLNGRPAVQRDLKMLDGGANGPSLAAGQP